MSYKDIELNNLQENIQEHGPVLQAIPGLKIFSTPFPFSFSGVSVDEVLLCEDGAVLPLVMRGDEDLQHCEGVLHLPPYVREGQASVGDENRTASL